MLSARSSVGGADKEPHHCNVVLLLGPPASGKSTLGSNLASRFGYIHFDLGKHIRENIPPGADLEEFAVSAVERVLRTERLVLLNGFPKYLHGLSLLTKRFTWVKIDFVLQLQVVDTSELTKRAARRHLSGERPEDDDENFRQRLVNYGKETLPVLQEVATLCQVFSIDALAPKYDVEFAAVIAWSEAKLRLEAAYGGTSRVRRDTDEADIEVLVCLISGEERMRPLLPARATVKMLRTVLTDDGETEFNLRFFFEGEEITESEVIGDLDGFQSGATIHMLHEEKPPPSPPRSESSRYSRPVCFTSDSLVRVLADDHGVDAQLPFSEVRVGDLVLAAHMKAGITSYRRVQRVWAHRWAKTIQTFELAQGCRVTLGHPILWKGRWTKPEDIHSGKETYEEFVYQLEVEGHVDIALVGGIQCALLGRYCGPEFGWNVFTRKTVKCDKQPCPKCAKAFLPGLDFSPSKLPESLLPPARFEPY